MSSPRRGLGLITRGRLLLAIVVTSPNQRIVDGRCLFRSSVFSFAVPGHNSNLNRVEGSVFPGPLLVGRCDQPRRIALKLENGSSFNTGPVHNPPHECFPLTAIVGTSCRQRCMVQRGRDTSQFCRAWLGDYADLLPVFPFQVWPSVAAHRFRWVNTNRVLRGAVKFTAQSKTKWN
jgi:hypothetical protein